VLIAVAVPRLAWAGDVFTRVRAVDVLRCGVSDGDRCRRERQDGCNERERLCVERHAQDRLQLTVP
jgi:hypothetical protein